MRHLLKIIYIIVFPLIKLPKTPSKPDPCVFNSIIKYETIPTRRRAEYVEEDYLCLKSGFNNTIEQYLSVPKRVVNDTCKNGKLGLHLPK